VHDGRRGAIGCIVIEHIQPVLPSRNVEASVDYYVGRLGFTLVFMVTEKPAYAVIRRDGVELHLQWHDASEWERTERPMLRFVVSEIDGLFEELRTKDVFHEKTALRKTPWGTREFAFYDPDGNGLTFYVDL
jgi:catechol 2,3-dioxygenase-like lactoylglutathione lyase family enzyme